MHNGPKRVRPHSRWYGHIKRLHSQEEKKLQKETMAARFPLSKCGEPTPISLQDELKATLASSTQAGGRLLSHNDFLVSCGFNFNTTGSWGVTSHTDTVIVIQTHPKLIQTHPTLYRRTLH